MTEKEYKKPKKQSTVIFFIPRVVHYASNISVGTDFCRVVEDYNVTVIKLNYSYYDRSLSPPVKYIRFVILFLMYI